MITRYPTRALVGLMTVFATSHSLAMQSSQNNVNALKTPANAMVTASGEVLPIYSIDDSSSPIGSIAFIQEGNNVRAIDRTEQELWNEDVGAGTLFGGFDYDADGWPDLGVVQATPTGDMCGSHETMETRIVIVNGMTGTLSSPIPWLEDICWDFDGIIYPSSQWTAGTLLFGENLGTFVATPYYSTNSWFRTWDDWTGTFGSHTFRYPSTFRYDYNYTEDQSNAWGQGHSYVENSHVANGLIVDANGQERLVFFTSGRAVQYAVEPHGPLQLLFDYPFLSAGRTDLAGRNYGLVTTDPEFSQHVTLVAGTNTYSMFMDMQSGTLGFDEWGQIERHVTIYDYLNNTLEDRFYSNAHDNNGGNKYQNRVLYPNSIYVKTSTGNPSRIAYNVYTDGRWYLHISEPGSTADRLALIDLFLWDIRDLDGDGIDEWIISPVRYPNDPDVPGYYFTKWATSLFHWNEAAQNLTHVKKYPGVIPYLKPTFRNARQTTSLSYLYPVLTIQQDRRLRLVMLDHTRTMQFVNL